MICPGCAGNLTWADGAYCERCMFVHPAPKPPPVPETPALPDGWALLRLDPDGDDVSHLSSPVLDSISMPQLRALLATQGLHVVSAKDMAVLGAMADWPLELLKQLADEWPEAFPPRVAARAELARRKP